MNIHTNLHSTQRKSFTAKAIFGLLLALVMAEVFATAGFAERAGNPRSGALHVTKECSQYLGQAGGFCTITGSNLNAIHAGMKVVYTNAADFITMTLDTDVVLDGPGNNNAYGHVVLDLHTFTGVITFSGGTGRFRGFHTGDLAVTCAPGGSPCAWDGPYSFAPPGRDK
jgi:hypothetical protein